MRAQAAVDAPRFKNEDVNGPSPHWPHGVGEGTDTAAINIDLGGVKPSLAAGLARMGYPVVPTSPSFRDSAFGVAAVVGIPQAFATRNSLEHTMAASDVKRKPGRAETLIPTRPLTVLLPLLYSANQLPDTLPGLRVTRYSVVNVAGKSRIRSRALLHPSEFNRMDFMLTTNMREYNAAMAHPGRLFAIAAPSEKVQSLFHDKSLFKAWMADNGLARYLAKTYPPDAPQFPCVIKPVKATNGQGVVIVNNMTSYRAALAVLQRVASHAGGHPTVAEFANVTSASGDLAVGFVVEEALVGVWEPTINFVALDGALIHMECKVSTYGAGLYVKSSADNSKLSIDGEGKTTSRRMYCSKEPVEAIDVVRRMTALSKYTGFGCVQYKVTSGGAVKVIEFNPRICGSALNNPWVLGRLLRAWWDAYSGRGGDAV